MRVVHSLYYGQACALKIASECTRNAPLTLDEVFSGQWRNCFMELQNSTRERLRRNTPPLCAEPPRGAQVYFLVNRRVSVEEKVRFAPVQNRNDTCVSVLSQLRWGQDKALCVLVQITHLTSGTTEPARKPACDKMAAGDDVRDSAVRHLAFIMDIYGWPSLCCGKVC